MPFYLEIPFILEINNPERPVVYKSVIQLELSLNAQALAWENRCQLLSQSASNVLGT